MPEVLALAELAKWVGEVEAHGAPKTSGSLKAEIMEKRRRAGI